MTTFQAIILGLVEGITEFLPVSSTAHLLVLQKAFALSSPSLFFDVVVQLGALGAVIVYFHKKILQLSRDAFTYLFNVSQGLITVTPANLPLGLTILVASIPVFIFGFLLRRQIEMLHTSMLVIAFMSIVVGLLLAYAQKQSQKEGKQIRPKNIIAMGLYQILALIPGTSRSGIIIAGGLFEGLSFSQALEYSFLMGIPSLGGAGLFELISAAKEGVSQTLLFPTLLATVVSFVSAMIMIHFLLKWVRKSGFMPFVYYRILFGIVALFYR